MQDFQLERDTLFNILADSRVVSSACGLSHVVNSVCAHACAVTSKG